MSTDPGLWPEGYDRVLLDTVDSTMAEAARRAGTLSGPTWILARRQTEPRGRLGRAWQEPPGNFAATLVLRPACTAAEGARRSFLAANALFETLAFHADRTALALKWPNDVLLNGGKVAGILLESRGRGPFLDWLAIGFGVNLIRAPRPDGHAGFEPVSLYEETGARVTPEEFLTTLAMNYATEERILQTLGFARIREGWLRHAARLGETITARTQTGEIRGRFETVDAEGNLVLDTPDGRATIAAADVYF